jgi:pyruvate formate lyase activating enzyme
MTHGIVFDIREFSVHDGPGIRTTVFLKGCPLTCMWCHNPESQSPRPQTMINPGSKRLAGRQYSAEELAAILNRQSAILKANEGGVTFSGGEPLMQAKFLCDVIDRLDDIHVLLDTCGFANEEDFRQVLQRTQLVYYDLKLADREAHKHYTGCDNALILSNLHVLAASNVPYVIRVPLIPGVTDSDENLEGIAHTVQGLSGLMYVELLPYNPAAGAKYLSAGMEFKPDYDESRPLNINTDIFKKLHIEERVA